MEVDDIMQASTTLLKDYCDFSEDIELVHFKSTSLTYFDSNGAQLDGLNKKKSMVVMLYDYEDSDQLNFLLLFTNQNTQCYVVGYLEDNLEIIISSLNKLFGLESTAITQVSWTAITPEFGNSHFYLMVFIKSFFLQNANIGFLNSVPVDTILVKPAADLSKWVDAVESEARLIFERITDLNHYTTSSQSKFFYYLRRQILKLPNYKDESELDDKERYIITDRTAQPVAERYGIRISLKEILALEQKQISRNIFQFLLNYFHQKYELKGWKIKYFRSSSEQFLHSLSAVQPNVSRVLVLAQNKGFCQVIRLDLTAKSYFKVVHGKFKENESLLGALAEQHSIDIFELKANLLAPIDSRSQNQLLLGGVIQVYRLLNLERQDFYVNSKYFTEKVQTLCRLIGRTHTAAGQINSIFDMHIL